MMRKVLITQTALLASALIAAGCHAGENPADDAFAYCAEAGVSDVMPDAPGRNAFPPSLANAMVEQGLISAEAPEPVRKANRWRCMDGAVWVCSVGANLPCDEKADLSRTPSPAAVDYCRENPDAVLPAYVTGRATVYSWVCEGAMPSIERQVFTPDAQGYLSEFWSPLENPDS